MLHRKVLMTNCGAIMLEEILLLLMMYDIKICKYDMVQILHYILANLD